MADEDVTPPDEQTPDPAPVDPAPAPEPDPSVDPKTGNKAAYEARKAREEAERLRKELDGYKRREDDARKAKLTEEQRIREENEALTAKVTRLETERLQQKVAAEFKLPPALAARLIGSDEDALRADAEELSKLVARPRVGSATDPMRDGAAKPRQITRAEMQKSPKLAREAAPKLQTGEWVLVG